VQPRKPRWGGARASYAMQGGSRLDLDRCDVAASVPRDSLLLPAQDFVEMEKLVQVWQQRRGTPPRARGDAPAAAPG
jgi:hypothetical protein